MEDVQKVTSSKKCARQKQRPKCQLSMERTRLKGITSTATRKSATARETTKALVGVRRLWKRATAAMIKRFPMMAKTGMGRSRQSTQTLTVVLWNKAESPLSSVRLWLSDVLVPGMEIMMQQEPSHQPLNINPCGSSSGCLSLQCDHVSLINLNLPPFLHHMELHVLWCVPHSLSVCVYVCICPVLIHCQNKAHQELMINWHVPGVSGPWGKWAGGYIQLDVSWLSCDWRSLSI